MNTLVFQQVSYTPDVKLSLRAYGLLMTNAPQC